MIQPDEISKVCECPTPAACKVYGCMFPDATPAAINPAPIDSKFIDADKVYPDVDLTVLGVYYDLNVSAMTGEGLHAKSDIAAQLGWRDMQIDTLAGQLVEANEWAAKWEPQANSAVTGMQLIQRSEGRARAQLEQANRRLAAAEGLLLEAQSWLTSCDIAYGLVDRISAALQPKAPDNG